MGLKIIIVGAGIAGLAASISLSRVGHDVVIHERSSFKSEIGAAITITPNGARILDRWNFDFKAAGLVEGQHFELVDGRTLQSISITPFGGFKAKYGYAMGFYHRVDLHRELRKIAESLGVRIQLGSSITDVKADGSVELENGGVVSADLVIIADGIHVRFPDAIATWLTVNSRSMFPKSLVNPNLS